MTRASFIVRKLSIPHLDITPIEVTPADPPWTNPTINIKTELMIKINKNMPNRILKEITKNTLSQLYNNHIQIYTDGSKSKYQNLYRVASGLYIPNLDIRFSYRIDNIHSIMIAELFSIYKALAWVKENLQPSHIVLLSDSKAAIQLLDTNSIENKLVIDCLSITRQLSLDNFEITIQWIPSHIGIESNETADKIAKEATKLPNITHLSPCYKDILNLINRNNFKLLQENWQQINTIEFLGNNKPDWGIRKYNNKTDRKTEIIITRLRVGKTLLNKHAHKINISNTPNCIYCNTEETIEHFILHCHTNL